MCWIFSDPPAVAAPAPCPSKGTSSFFSFKLVQDEHTTRKNKDQTSGSQQTHVHDFKMNWMIIIRTVNGRSQHGRLIQKNFTFEEMLREYILDIFSPAKFLFL